MLDIAFLPVILAFVARDYRDVKSLIGGIMTDKKKRRTRQLGARLTDYEYHKIARYANEKFIGVGSALRQLALTRLEILSRRVDK